MNDAANEPTSAYDKAPDEPSPLRLTETAFHEAGHAVMAMILRRTIQKVTVESRKLQTGGARLGACGIKKGRSKVSSDWLEDEALILLAGMVAEARFTGQYCQQSAAQDLLAVRRLLGSRANSQRQLDRLERRALDKTEHLLSHACYAKAIELIAHELVQKTTISGRAVQHLFDQAAQQFPR